MIKKGRFLFVQRFLIFVSQKVVDFEAISYLEYKPPVYHIVMKAGAHLVNMSITLVIRIRRYQENCRFYKNHSSWS